MVFFKIHANYLIFYIYLAPLSGSEPASHVLYIITLFSSSLYLFSILCSILFHKYFIFILMLILDVNNNLAFQFSFKVYLLALVFILLYPILHQFMSFA